MATRLDVAAEMCLVPPDAVVEGALIMTTYISGEGKHSMQYLALGDISMAQLIGMMEMVKNQILHQS